MTYCGETVLGLSRKELSRITPGLFFDLWAIHCRRYRKPEPADAP